MNKNSQQFKNMADVVKTLGPGIVPFRPGDVIEVKIEKIFNNRILVDVMGLCYGVIPEREFSIDTPEIKEGDKVLAYVLMQENDEGNVILSLRRADNERLWQTLEERYQNAQSINIRIMEANKGGLIVGLGEIQGFLPVSQLSATHYPKVSGDRSQILSKLNSLVGQNLQVKIINFDKSANKLIFSEKAAMDQLQVEAAKKLKVDQTIKGTISGMVDFGLFVNLGEVEGLVHISEVSWEKVEDLGKLFKIGDEIKVKIIGVEGGRVSLSIKQLIPDPWINEVKEYQAGKIFQGKITRISPFGAFVQLTKKIDGLVHISELGDKITNPSEVVEIGKTYPFKVLSIEGETHKVNLSLKQASDYPPPPKKEKVTLKKKATKKAKPKKTKK